MSRLIDADDFIKKFNYAKANTEEENIMCATVRRMIQEESTAFDMDKVMESLMNRFRVVSKDEDLEWNRAIDYAIKIVKGGGVE